MITLIPSALLIVFGISIILLYQFRKGLGIPWIIAVGGAIVAWILTLVLHWIPPLPFYLIGWTPVENFSNLIGFQLDLISWPFSFALTSLLLAVMLTSAARINESPSPMIWSAYLILAGFGLLTVIAATPLTILMAWMLFDLSELIVLQGSVSSSDRIKPVIYSFSIRLISILCIAIAMILSRSEGMILDFSQIFPKAGVFLFLGAVIRLGLLPVNLPYPAGFQYRRELGTLMRGIATASALVLLVRLPETILPGNWQVLLRGVVSIAALYCAVMWLASQDEMEARPYWISGVVGLALVSVVNGFQITSMVWGLVLVLMGGIIGLYSHRSAGIQYIPALAILSFLGLPFTPAAGGWVGLVNTSFTAFHPLYFLTHILLTLGLWKHLFKPAETVSHLERWAQSVYPAGLISLILSHWIIATWGWPGSYTIGVWWASLIPLFVIALGYFFWTHTSFWGRNRAVIRSWSEHANRFLLSPLTQFLRMRWLYQLANLIYQLLGNLVSIVNQLLEGEGSLLWVFLLLVILATIILPGGVS